MSRALARTAAAHTATGGGGSESPKEPSAGPAKVIPFPIARRVAFLERLADAAASYRNPDNYLSSAYRQQEEAMRRRGISENVIQSELAALDRAIQARLGEYA